MADYYGIARSNYFNVEDEKEFKELCEIYEVGFHKKDEDNMFMIYPNNEYGAWNCVEYYVESDGDDDDVIHDSEEFLDELRKMIPKDEILILMESGAEKLRFVGGIAIAINGDGEVLNVELNDIYQKITDEWNTSNFTRCEM